MSSRAVFVVRHFSYDYHQFERLIGLTTTFSVGERIAREAWGHDIIVTDNFVEHVKLAKKEVSHIYIVWKAVIHE